MKYRHSLWLLAPLAMASPTIAMEGAPNFWNLDRNTDGYISAKEAQADHRVVERFSEADRDRDGYISAEEFTVTWILPQ